MKFISLIAILILCMNLSSCKSIIQKTETNNQVTHFDFSSIEEFKLSKLKRTIVNDFDNVFGESQRSSLTKLLYDYNIKTTRQIAIVTIGSIRPYEDIHKYAVDLANYWGVGSREKDNGLVIVFCKPERKIGIATGTGTQLVLTDQICKKVIDSTMIPEFINSNFYLGIKEGVTELIMKWG